ncbi:sensor histidine kinase [Dactylosporangium vinaceum]|uniref:histidine kinase n=1 Tax=Dactylosporangium vinaceum TaxID=53362 RepID=A0ABV5MPX9_9ACTN|nr:nitrate- and nitrite sensing domain-containing protein [Dactylosporangium vinaceum]UAB94499.1 sensor histidine kinase [Dactylosporangium vinaceum]
MPASKRPAGGGFRFRPPRLADARIRSKLGLILLVPLLAIVTLAVLRLQDASSRAGDADTVGDLTRLSADVSGLAQQVHLEKMAAAALLASPDAKADAYNRQIVETDAAVARYGKRRATLGDVPAGVRDRLERIDDQLEVLAAIRKDVGNRQGVSVSEVVLRYGVVAEDLVSYREAVAQVRTDQTLADELRAAAAFSKAKARVSEQEAITYAALKSGTVDSHQLAALLATLTGQQEAFVAFSLSASVPQRRIVDAAIAGDATQMADDLTSTLQRTAGQAPAVDAEDAVAVFGAVNDLMRWTEARLDEQLVADAAAIGSTVRRQVVIESAVLFAILALVVGLAFVTARSMIRSLRRLRQTALGVAEHDLPELVLRLRDAQTVRERSPQEIADQVRSPAGIESRDEIGEVVRAFDTVHREAVRVAAEQAVLRNSVSSMFLSLARRSQTLVDRMIGQLDRIERGEEDPKRLAQLFQLDHLATRMRRNDENVLVLAGADTAPPRRQDAALMDVIRAAQSEIELYERIEFGELDDGIFVAAPAVNDVVRLLAELLDNATRFSPPHAPVVVSGQRLGDRTVVCIDDRGLGIAREQLVEYNRRLAEPAPVDVAAFRLMGIAVVGRLAARHRITVQLSPNGGGGTSAEVMLPASALVLQRAALPTRAPRPVEAPPPPPRTRSAPAMPAVPAMPAPMANSSMAGMPMAGMPMAGMPMAGMAMAEDDTTELPIFREIEETWFHERGHSVMTGPAPEPVRAQPAADGNGMWRTRADDGWRAAAAAQKPRFEGSTESGLPIRSPQAQLVPGGVPEKPAAKLKRPSAEELRGLLSSYQRGVQRGRQAGGAVNGAPATEEKRA